MIRRFGEKMQDTLLFWWEEPMDSHQISMKISLCLHKFWIFSNYRQGGGFSPHGRAWPIYMMYIIYIYVHNDIQNMYTYICMYVCMYVCMYEYVYIYMLWITFFHAVHATSRSRGGFPPKRGLCSESHVTRPGHEDFSESRKFRSIQKLTIDKP